MASADKELQYGVWFQKTVVPLRREFICIEQGGQWKNKKGVQCGLGNFEHYKRAVHLIWPEITWHRWLDLVLKEWLDHRVVGIMGPANSGKTCSMALFHLVDYYAFASTTTIIICSTSQKMLENRIWGEMKKWHRIAKSRFTWLPGNLIEGQLRLVTDPRSAATEGRDFRNGVIGVPCKPGGKYVGLGDFIGIKNKRVRLCGDELQLLPNAFVDCIPNLMKNPDCRVTGLGNPKETTDALGKICEPAADMGGWEGGIDQTPKTKSWPTRWADGVCIQLSGSDSPNTDVDAAKPVPFPFLITRKNMEDDAAVWGRDDWHFTMFNEGRMPRGQGSRRVITRRLCEVGHAFDSAKWQSNQLTQVTFLDAAYRAVGGDRCVFGHLRFGFEASDDPLVNAIATTFVTQGRPDPRRKMILELVSQKIIPISGGVVPGQNDAEEQICNFVMRENKELGVPPENFFYDSGMRTSLVQTFSRLYSNKVNAIDCGGKATQRRVSSAIDVACVDYYSKFITELWYSVRLIIEAGQFRGMTDDLCWEGCAREFKLVSGNRIEVESKDDMKQKTGRSPDLFDAMAIGCEGARRLGFVIARSAPAEEELTDQKWKRDLKEKARAWAKSGSLVYQ